MIEDPRLLELYKTHPVVHGSLSLHTLAGLPFEDALTECVIALCNVNRALQDRLDTLSTEAYYVITIEGGMHDSPTPDADQVS